MEGMDMEKLRLKGQDLGLSTLQKQTQAGRQTQTERKTSMWKTVKVRPPQGLGEIEQLDREEGSNKVMQALELFMRAHPTQWNESAVQLLLAVPLSSLYEIQYLPTNPHEGIYLGMPSSLCCFALCR